MKLRVTWHVMVCLAWLCTGPSLHAHHSFAAFDMTRTYQVTGTVKAFEWTNPHTWVRVTTEGTDGKPILWNVESGAPNISVRLGWRSTDLKPGDKVTMVFHPMRDGTHGGTLAYVLLADGRILPGNGGRPNIPSATNAKDGKVDIAALLVQVPAAPGTTAASGTVAPTPPKQAAGGTPAGPSAANGQAVPAFLQPFKLPVPPNYPQPTSDPRNLEGTYVNSTLIRSDISTVPFKPETRAIVERKQKSMRAGKPIGGLSDLCRQPGMATELSLNFPFTILQTAEQILIVQEEYHSIVRIHMNQPLPEKPPATTYEGYSVGRWEGDTLVVDTIGIDTRTSLGATAAPHSDALKQRLTIRKINGGKNLEFQFTFDDPKAYTQPWSLPPIVMDWRSDYAHFDEYNCEETSGTADSAAAYGIKVEQ